MLVVSKVANFSIDLPEANVAVQLSGQFGSRQEEAQRLGRIMRPKLDGGQASFYTIVTAETVEQTFALNRQRFLAEQGYSYDIVDAPNCDPGTVTPNCDPGTVKGDVYDWCMARTRTNIEIDDAYVQMIMDRFGVRTKTDAVDLALRHLAGQPMSREEALAMRGGHAIDALPPDVGPGTAA